VRVVARGHPGGDPVAVRVGNTMFALRRFEAERVLVAPLRGQRHERPMASLRLALLGNPNCGKTALFNLLTGSRQKVANYPGVTVDRKEGQLTTPAGKQFRVLDLPGAYSLNAVSIDEEITRDVVLGTLAGEQRPDLIVCVSDATNLKLNLRLVLEVKRLGLPMVLALNMTDLARNAASKSTCPRWRASWACRWSAPSPSSAAAPAS
jgi:small GTP-binding protein